jgi:hypothetical protein
MGTAVWAPIVQSIVPSHCYDAPWIPALSALIMNDLSTLQQAQLITSPNSPDPQQCLAVRVLHHPVQEKLVMLIESHVVG